MKDKYKLGNKESYHDVPIEIENEVNINSPELQNKCPERQPWIAMGFQNQADYECHMRRMSDRKKGSGPMGNEEY